jgi:hypothetical protein
VSDTITKSVIGIYYVVEKCSRQLEQVHPYNPISIEKHDEGNVFVENTLSNPHEDIANWVSKESAIYNSKRTEADKKLFYYRVRVVKSTLDVTNKPLKILVSNEEE